MGELLEAVIVWPKEEQSASIGLIVLDIFTEESQGFCYVFKETFVTTIHLPHTDKAGDRPPRLYLGTTFWGFSIPPCGMIYNSSLFLERRDYLSVGEAGRLI